MLFPKVIEIQFHNRCNSDCLICPYKDMNYVPNTMNEKIFDKFLTEIEDGKIERIIPYLNNEPFLQNDYIDKLKRIRKKCPNIEIEVSTNVSMLNETKIKNLIDLNLTELRLSVFGYSDAVYKKMMPKLDKNTVFNNLNIISKYFNNTKTIVSIIMIDDGEISEDEFKNMNELAKKLNFKFERWGFLDRCKNVDYKNNGIYNEKICGCEQNRPLERMHILSNGDVIVCCQDWSHSTIMGNIGKDSIENIWNSNEYVQFRKSLYGKNTNKPELCKRCKLAIPYDEV